MSAQGPRSAGRHRGRLDASMTLLTEVMRHPLDPGYQAAAERRAAGGQPPRKASGTAILGAFAIALGAMTAIAAAELRAPQPAVIAARKVLEKEITARRDDVQVFQAQLDRIDADIADLRDEALADTSPELLGQIQADSLVNGFLPIRGPGLVITLADAETAVGVGNTGGEDVAPRVEDRDLQRVVNALWAGGAEAIAINGQRLTVTSTIRSAGSVIHVNYTPILNPYHVEAIGDPAAMQAHFARSRAAAWLQYLRNEYRITWSPLVHSDLGLPGALPVTLDYAAMQDGPVESHLSLNGTPAASPASAHTPGVTPGQEDDS